MSQTSKIPELGASTSYHIPTIEKKTKQSKKPAKTDKEKLDDKRNSLIIANGKYNELIKKHGSICDTIIKKELLSVVLGFTSAKNINDIVCYYGACYLKSIEVDKKTTDIEYKEMLTTIDEYAGKFIVKYKKTTNDSTGKVTNKKLKTFGISTNPHITPFLYRDLILVLKGEVQQPFTLGEPGHKTGIDSPTNNKLVTKKALINGEVVGISVKIYFLTILALILDECCILMTDDELKTDAFTIENLVKKLANVSNKRKNGLVEFILAISSDLTDELPEFSAVNNKNKQLIQVLEIKLINIQNLKVKISDKQINFKDFKYLKKFCKVVSTIFEKFLYMIAKCRSADYLTYNHSSLTKTTFEPIIRILNNLHKKLNDSFVLHMKKIPAEVKLLLIISDIKHRIRELVAKQTSKIPIVQADGVNNPEGNPKVVVKYNTDEDKSDTVEATKDNVGDLNSNLSEV